MRKDSFRDFVLEQLDGLRGVSCEAMFSGYGLRCGSVFFGIIHKGGLYFRVGDDTRPSYVTARSGPFRYGSGRVMRDYLEVPVDILESPPRLLEWAEQAVVAAQAKGKG